MLEKATRKNPDIVLGDFNSDMLHMLRPDSSRLDFLKTLGCNDMKAGKWHLAPYEMLNAKGFSRVEHNLPTVVPKPTIGVLPDGIWYKYSVLKCIMHDGLPHQQGSDHDGIIARFKL